MMYIDPKDQPAHPDWPEIYKTAWTERKRLRMEHTRVEKEIEVMDSFMSVYESLEARAEGARDFPKNPNDIRQTHAPNENLARVVLINYIEYMLAIPVADEIDRLRKDLDYYKMESKSNAECVDQLSRLYGKKCEG